MTDGDTVPVSEMGIGDDEVKETLEQHAETISEHWGGDLTDVDVNTTLLDGVAHLQLVFHDDVDTLQDDLQNYLIASGLVMFHPERDGGHMELRVTPLDVYETWSGMDGPLEE